MMELKKGSVVRYIFQDGDSYIGVVHEFMEDNYVKIVDILDEEDKSRSFDYINILQKEIIEVLYQSKYDPDSFYNELKENCPELFV